MDKVNTAKAKMLMRLASQLQVSIDPNVPVPVFKTLIAVSLNEGKSLTEIAQATGGNISTASRHLMDLGERNRKREPGYGLVVREHDAVEYRKNNYSLSPRGKLVMQQLFDVLGD